ncbi:ATP-dependent RNA helicase SUPV3L1, mitochondrial [Eumeta japonica]|uniref:ATP-dependent RNA helicase SUPV3L1, mitochondrial n=1 Tax=Eumeta variegata TaxID=151549 RepID=A0A4C1UCT8_EUMVA|nr:ATP-dependent RNA helicase SUPV3L1, mitochondrial [Eumeta japonica]
MMRAPKRAYPVIRGSHSTPILSGKSAVCPHAVKNWTLDFRGLQAEEIHLCGEAGAINLIEEICITTGEELEIRQYKRLTDLHVEDVALGSLDNVQPGDCIVCFNKNDIYSVSRAIEQRGHEVAVIYGSLPPGTKLAQANKFNDPESSCKVMVATDAIGLGINLSIRRIIFYSLIKPIVNEDGDKEMDVISISQALQIAGRAGRYGSNWETGYVTTFKPEDLPTLKTLLSKSPEPVPQAGLHPTAEQMELYAYHLPHASLSSLMMVRQYSRNEPLTKSWLCNTVEWPLPAPKTIMDLVHLESVFDVLELYLWLSYRFPDMFPDVRLVREMETELDAIIQQGIFQITRLLKNSEKILRDEPENMDFMLRSKKFSRFSKQSADESKGKFSDMLVARYHVTNPMTRLPFAVYNFAPSTTAPFHAPALTCTLICEWLINYGIVHTDPTFESGVKHTRILEEGNVQTVIALYGEKIRIICQDDFPLQQCSFLQPSGTKIMFSDLQYGTPECFIDLEVIEENVGLWSCHLVPQDSTRVIEKTINVRTGERLAAVNHDVVVQTGADVTLMCITTEGRIPLDHCQFNSPTGDVININRRTSNLVGRYSQPANKSLDRGDCAVTVHNVSYHDSGLWQCSGRLEHELFAKKANIQLHVGVSVVSDEMRKPDVFISCTSHEQAESHSTCDEDEAVVVYLCGIKFEMRNTAAHRTSELTWQWTDHTPHRTDELRSLVAWQPRETASRGSHAHSVPGLTGGLCPAVDVQRPGRYFDNQNWVGLFVQYNARNSTAVKSVTKASQSCKLGPRGEEGRVGERQTCALHHSQAIQSGRVSCVVLYVTAVFLAYREIKVNGVDTVLAMEGETQVVVNCKKDIPMAYCGFLHPNGTRFSFSILRKGESIEELSQISLSMARSALYAIGADVVTAPMTAAIRICRFALRVKISSKPFN